METEFYKIEYTSCEGNYRWMIVEVPVGVTEDQLISQLLSDYGYDDAPAEYIGSESWYEDEMCSDWTHLEVW